MEKGKEKICDDGDAQKQLTSSEVLPIVASKSEVAVAEAAPAAAWYDRLNLDKRSSNLPYLRPNQNLFISRKKTGGDWLKLIIMFSIIAFLFGACVIPTTFKYIVTLRCVWFCALIVDLCYYIFYKPPQIGLILVHTGVFEKIKDESNGIRNTKDISFHKIETFQRRYFRVKVSAQGSFKGQDFDGDLFVYPVLVSALMRKYVTADKILAFRKHYCSVTGVYLHSHEDVELESDSIQLAAMLAEYDRIRHPLLDFSKPLN
jgi:hypothetical protein